MSEAAPPNLYVKIATIIGEIHEAHPKPSGKNQFNAEAFSIEDVEGYVAPMLAKHLIVIRPGNPEIKPVENQKGLWQASMRFTVINAEKPDECFEDEWVDIGGNPAAATSFAAKGYYKKLFHIADATEEGGKVRVEGASPTPVTAPSTRPTSLPTPTSRGQAAPGPVPSTPTPSLGRGPAPAPVPGTPRSSGNMLTLKRPEKGQPAEPAAIASAAPTQDGDPSDVGLRTEALTRAMTYAQEATPGINELQAFSAAEQYLNQLAMKNWGKPYSALDQNQLRGLVAFLRTKFGKEAEGA